MAQFLMSTEYRLNMAFALYFNIVSLEVHFNTSEHKCTAVICNYTMHGHILKNNSVWFNIDYISYPHASIIHQSKITFVVHLPPHRETEL